jgi:hypothetical protein
VEFRSLFKLSKSIRWQNLQITGDPGETHPQQVLIPLKSYKNEIRISVAA